MYKLISIALAISLSLLSLKAQDTNVLWDMDKDGRQDYVEIDSVQSRIVCKLSSLEYVPIYSLEVDSFENSSYLLLDDVGFGYHNSWMRAGYSCYLTYDTEEKRIRLSGMGRYEYGNAVNDGSGESYVDLITGYYTGMWNYYDWEEEELITLPTIEAIMPFPPIYLEDFTDDIYFDYGGRCSSLYYECFNDIMNSAKPREY